MHYGILWYLKKRVANTLVMLQNLILPCSKMDIEPQGR